MILLLSSIWNMNILFEFTPTFWATNQYNSAYLVKPYIVKGTQITTVLFFNQGTSWCSRWSPSSQVSSVLTWTHVRIADLHSKKDGCI